MVTQPQKRSGGSTEVPKATARVGPYSTRTPSSLPRSPWVRASSAILSQSTTRLCSTRACRHRSHFATATARGSPPMLGRRNTSGAMATPGPARGLTAPAHTPWSPLFKGASTKRVWPSKTCRFPSWIWERIRPSATGRACCSTLACPQPMRPLGPPVRTLPPSRFPQPGRTASPLPRTAAPPPMPSPSAFRHYRFLTSGQTKCSARMRKHTSTFTRCLRARRSAGTLRTTSPR